MDLVCGDGDCGNSLSNLSNAVLKDIDEDKFDFNYPHQVFLHLSTLLENGGGSLCILLAIFFSAAAQAFSLKNLKDEKINWFRLFTNVVNLGVGAVTEYGRAKPGDRSIIDPLTAIKLFLNDYSSTAKQEGQDLTQNCLKSLVDVTHKSAESTTSMIPKVGRASYIDAKLIIKPDAGSMGISSIISSIYKAYLIYYSS